MQRLKAAHDAATIAQTKPICLVDIHDFARHPTSLPYFRGDRLVHGWDLWASWRRIGAQFAASPCRPANAYVLAIASLALFGAITFAAKIGLDALFPSLFGA